MEKKKDTKKTIAQWTGVILALGASSLMFALSMVFGVSVAGENIWGILLGLVVLAVVFYLFALLIYKIVYFIIR